MVKKKSVKLFAGLSFVIWIICFSLFLTSFVSASRLPVVGGDNQTWGSILNDFLNVSHNASGGLKSNTVYSAQIVDGSITDEDISDTTNITTSGTGFFGWLGSIASRVTKLFVQDIDFSGTISGNGNIDINGSINVTSGNDVCIEGGNCLSSAGGGGSSSTNASFNPVVGFTSSAYSGSITNGSLIGYAAANAICNAEYPGSHFCLKSEVLKTIANGNYSFSGTAWFQNGPPGYTANADDCSGWTTDSNTYLGPFWNWDYNSQAGKAVLTNCAQFKPLMCCGGDY